MKNRVISFLVLSTLFNPLYAQDFNFDNVISDELLPPGRQAIIAETRIGSGTTYFNNQSQEEPLFSSLNNVPLNLLLSLPPPPNLGVTQVSSKLSGRRVNFTYGYGISENLTAGFIIGWGKLINQVEFSVANAGIPSATSVVQSAITAAPYGYKTIGTTATEGVLDPQIGVRWRVMHNENSSTIVVPAFRIGLSQKDDSDNLMDIHLTDGSSALMLGVEQRYRLPAAELLAYVQYTHPLADEFQARPYAVGSSPLVPQASTETLDRKVGGMWKVQFEGAHRWDSWRAMARVEYSRTAATHYTSTRGQAVSGLEANTESWDLIVRTGVSWNNFSEYLASQSGLPVLLAVEYSSMLDGRNVAQSDNLYLTVTLPF